MSFILDALRKSESRRQLDAMPELMRVPVAVPRERMPPWALGVIAALTIALVVAIVVPWRSSEREPARPTSAADRPPVAVAVPSTPSLPTTAPSEDAAGTVAGTSGMPAPLSAENAAAAAAPTGNAPGTTSTSAPPPALTQVPAVTTTGPAGVAQPQASDVDITRAPPPTRARIEPSTLPSAEALRAAGIGIPALDLQLLVTSTTPSRRLVVINGNRYREGDRLREGPELVEIAAEGAVLRQGGSDFLLATD